MGILKKINLFRLIAAEVRCTCTLHSRRYRSLREADEALLEEEEKRGKAAEVQFNYDAASKVTTIYIADSNLKS